jgi:3-deoxy-D-manno-octulosonic-acid transferase
MAKLIMIFAGAPGKARAAMVMMVVYSSLLLAVLVLGAPYWLLRMATSGRYRAGLAGRLGLVPLRLRAVIRARRVIWVHAVSVGEVLAAVRLVTELSARLGDQWVVVVSTTTSTGQALARERLGPARIFYYPLDIGWAVRAYVKALQPRMLVLMESELWPRMLVECGRAGVPVVVVNARVSDRSFARGIRVRAIWRPVLRRVDRFLAQSEEDARRLVLMGARESSVEAVGNLKYDVRAPRQSRVVELIREAADGRPIIVAGSTVARKSDNSLSEDEIVLQAWAGALRRDFGAVLVLAPRHPERFLEVEAVASEFRFKKVSELLSGAGSSEAFATIAKSAKLDGDSTVEIILLDTIGDLAAVYELADVAFVGGSLVAKGGHSPLEPAQFGVPVVMGPSYENFRDVVGRMQATDGIRIVKDGEELASTLVELLSNREMAVGVGERGRAVFEAQAGATSRTVAALMELLDETAVKG